MAKPGPPSAADGSDWAGKACGRMWQFNHGLVKRHCLMKVADANHDV